MAELIQAPVSREQFRRWIEDPNSMFMDVQKKDGQCLTIHNDTVLPEITVLFAGDAENFKDTAEIVGMYDNRIQEFRFVSGQLASIVEGIPEAERCMGSEESGEIYSEISRYAKEAVEQRGYRFLDRLDAQYAPLRKTAQACLSAMQEYAAVLAAKGEADNVQDMRNLAKEMLHFWRDPVYATYEKGYEQVEREYLKKFDHAVSAAASGQVPVFSREQAANMFEGLAVHAEEAAQNEDAFSVWECCRTAARLGIDYSRQGWLFSGDFTEHYGRFTEFGSRDCEHLQEGWLLGKPVLLFNRTISEDCVPEGWNSYHLAGRNLRYADTLQKTVPEENYVGTVLSPHTLIPDGEQSCGIQNSFISMGGICCLEEFCQRHHLPEPDMSRIFPQLIDEISAELLESALAEIAEMEKVRKEKLGLTMGGM